MEDRIEALLGLLHRCLNEDANAWLDQAMERATTELTVRTAIAACPRKLKRSPLTGELPDWLPGPKQAWDCADLGRAMILWYAMAHFTRDDQVKLVRGLLLRGSADEQQVVLRVLPLLPAPKRFTDIAIDICRTNVIDVFRAIACDNPFPRDYFPQASFNQMVLKAIFLGLPVEPILGLASRQNDELRRMARDFAAERSAAGRSVPSDLQRLQ